MGSQPLFARGHVTGEGEMDWHRGRARGAGQKSETIGNDVLRSASQVGKISLSWIDEENGALGRLEQWRHFVLSPFAHWLTGFADVELHAACEEMLSDEHGGYRGLAILSCGHNPLPRLGRIDERASARSLPVQAMTREPPRAEWKALQTVHARANARVRLASDETDWTGIAASRFRLGRTDVNLPALTVPAFGVNYGEPLKLERTLHGRRTSGSVAPGHLAILPPDADTRWIFNRTADVVLVYVAGDLLAEAIEDSVDRDPRGVEIVPRFLIRDLVLERTAHRLLREITEPRSESRLAAETLALDVAAHLVAAHSNLEVLPRGSRSIAPTRMKRVHEFVWANLDRPVSLREMAQAAGMSVFHFARGFKEAMRSPPHRYLVEQRLLRARTLLHDPERPIGEIARAVGYTHSHFTALFTRHMGMAPSEFREVLDA
jgi:AraC family transcriptional regulator